MKHRRDPQPGGALRLLVLEAGEAFPATLLEHARSGPPFSARLQAIGAFREVTLGFYDLERKQYRRIEVGEQVEAVSLSGNLTWYDGRPRVHAHAVVARRDGSTVAGHLLEAVVDPTLELMLEELPGGFARVPDERSGLPLIDPGRVLEVEPAAPGRRRWAIPEGYIPAESTGPEPEMLSHETACILNAGAQDARVELRVFFADRDPVGPYRIVVPARRTLHLRFNELSAPRLPRATDFASLLESDVPVVVQHTRLDSRQSANALLSTMAFPVG